jgi:lipoprotein Spr
MLKPDKVKPFLILACLAASLFLQGCGSSHGLTGSTGTENAGRIQTKYAVILGVPPAEVKNIPLYSFIESWTGAPYVYGGKTISGVDCSGFAEALFKTVYGLTLTGSSRDLYDQCKPISKEKLQEGDLLFFKIDSDKISHVGVYLAMDKFVHATVKKGVMISDLKEPYYLKYYYKGGRLKEK